MTRHWFALALITGLTGYSFPVAAQDQPDSPAIVAVRKLSHPKFAERETADRQLRQMGADAVTALRVNFEKLDSEGQMRARKIIAAIDEQALNARLLVPPRIRLLYKDTPLTDALKDLNAKTGLQFALNDRTMTVVGRNVTLDTGEVPLWEGIERFLAATKLTETVVSGPVAASSNTYYSGRTTVRYSGYAPAISAARLVGLTAGVREGAADLKSAVRVQTLQRSHPVNQRVGGSNELTLGLDLAAPASFGLRSILGVDATRVEDDLHQALTQKLTPGESRNASPYEYGNMGFGGNIVIQGGLIIDGISQPTLPTGLNAHQTTLTLNLGKLRSTRLTALEGVIHAVALMPEEPIHIFSELQKTGEQLHQTGSFEFRIKEVKELKKGHWTIRCSYESSSSINSRPWSNEGETTDSQVGSYDFSSNNGLPKLSFNDQSGKPIKKTNTNIVGQQYRSNNQGMILTSEILITVLPVDDQLPKELVVSGRRIAALKVPFSLKDVLLP